MLLEHQGYRVLLVQQDQMGIRELREPQGHQDLEDLTEVLERLVQQDYQETQDNRDQWVTLVLQDHKDQLVYRVR